MRLFFVVVACAALLVTTLAATSSGTESGLQYDEISRVLAPGSTPPPPGAFQTDYAQLRDGKLMAENQMMPSAQQMQQMQSAMMPQMGLSTILVGLLNPGMALLQLVQGAAMGGIMGGMASGMMNKYRRYQSGQLQRFAFYGTLAREENVATKKVYITDAQKDREIQLDLNAQTYKVGNVTNPMDQKVPAPSGGGSAQIDVSAQTTQGQHQTIEGIDAVLYDTVENVAITNATGGCLKSNMRVETVQYVAPGISVPPAMAMTFDRILRDHPEFAAGPHCTPSINRRAGGVQVPQDRLIVYSRTTIDMPEEQAKLNQMQGSLPPYMRGKSMGIAIVTERGNVKPVAQTDVQTLFSVPSGYTQQP